MDAGQLAHALDRLAVTGRVLYVAAHPDDENTRLLAYLANARHVTVAYLSMTRGGGGQNLIGREQAELLDVIRTEELLAARRLDGAQQRFTRMRDFGYSKSAQGDARHLGPRRGARRRRLGRSARSSPTSSSRASTSSRRTTATTPPRRSSRARRSRRRPIRKRFPGAARARAPRPGRRRASCATSRRWRDEPSPKARWRSTSARYDARLGLSYGELAALSRSQHKSQGFGVPGERGAVVERFVTHRRHAADDRPARRRRARLGALRRAPARRSTRARRGPRDARRATSPSARCRRSLDGQRRARRAARRAARARCARGARRASSPPPPGCSCARPSPRPARRARADRASLRSRSSCGARRS